MEKLDEHLLKRTELVSGIWMDFVFAVIIFLGIIIMAVGIYNFFTPTQHRDNLNKKQYSIKKSFAILEVIGGAILIGIKAIYTMFHVM